MPKSKNDRRVGKLVNLDPELWDLLQADARNHGRSVTKQIEAIVLAHFKIGSTGIGVKPQAPPGFITAHVTDLVIGEHEAQPAVKRQRKKKIA